MHQYYSIDSNMGSRNYIGGIASDAIRAEPRLIESFDMSSSMATESSIKSEIGMVNEPKRKDNMKLILSQNIIEGYWDENEETKELDNILNKDEINKINIKIKSLNKKKEDEKRIKYTILVIYYLNTKCNDKIDEYKLIINKGKKYLLNQGIQYDEFIKEI